MEIAQLAAPRSAPLGVGTRYVAVGRLVPQKNFGLLLEAFAAAARPRDRLTILGEGPERRILVQRARELGIERRVSLARSCRLDCPGLARQRRAGAVVRTMRAFRR